MKTLLLVLFSLLMSNILAIDTRYFETATDTNEYYYYLPFSESLDDYACGEKRVGFNLKDTISNHTLIYCDELIVTTQCVQSGRYEFLVETWNPMQQKFDLFLTLELIATTDTYSLTLDTAQFTDYSDELENITPDTNNVEVIGYKSICMLIKTMDEKYFNLFRKCMDLARADTDLIFYMPLLDSLDVVNTGIWYRTGLGRFSGRVVYTSSRK